VNPARRRRRLRAGAFFEYRQPERTGYEYEEAQSEMSRDREGAVGRALRAVRAAGLTRSREAAKGKGGGFGMADER